MPVKRSSQPPDEREDRRLRAWELDQQGWSQRQIAQELGVTQGAVSQWLKRARMGGIDALRRNPAHGQRTKLSDEQIAQLPDLLARGAAAFGFQDDRWTTRRIAAALQHVFGVTYHPGHIGRLMHRHYPGWPKEKSS